MNRSEKGMVATMDVMIFITILAIVAATLIAPQPVEDGDPDASRILDDMSGISLGSNLLLEDSGNAMMSIWNFSAVCISTGETGFIEDYVSGILQDTLTFRYGYFMTMEYRGDSVSIGEMGAKPLSECRKEMEVIGDDPLIVHLVVY